MLRECEGFHTEAENREDIFIQVRTIFMVCLCLKSYTEETTGTSTDFEIRASAKPSLMVMLYIMALLTDII